MADHQYFTRSKTTKDSSPDQDQRKRKKTDHNEHPTEITATNTTVAQQNESIVQLLEQIVDATKEMKKAQELTNLAIAASFLDPNDRRSPFHRPSSNQPTPRYRPPPYHYAQHPNFVPNYQSPPPSYSHQNQFAGCPRFQTPAQPRQNYPNHHRVPPSQSNYNPTYPNTNKKPPRIFTPLAESRTSLFKRLTAAGLIQPAPPKAMNANSPFFRGDRICAYHSNSIGHNTEDCITLKHKIQDLIDHDMVTLQTVTPNVNNIPNA